MKEVVSPKEEKIDNLNFWREKKELLALDWIDNERREKNRVIKYGEIYTCQLGENIGHEQCKERPVLVVSDTRYNKNGIVVIIPLTSTVLLDKRITDRKKPKILTHYVLRAEKYDYLRNDSTVNSSQIRSISTIRLQKYVGSISQEDCNAIKVRLRTLLGM